MTQQSRMSFELQDTRWIYPKQLNCLRGKPNLPICIFVVFIRVADPGRVDPDLT